MKALYTVYEGLVDQQLVHIADLTVAACNPLYSWQAGALSRLWITDQVLRASRVAVTFCRVRMSVEQMIISTWES